VRRATATPRWRPSRSRSGPSRWPRRCCAPTRPAGTLGRDLAGGAQEVQFQWDVGGHRRLAGGGPELDDTNRTSYRIVEGDPLSASVRVRCESTLARDDWHTRVETDSHMTATATEFLVSHTLDAYEHDERVYARTWTLRFPRDGV
jgi:hypothetical protein